MPYNHRVNASTDKNQKAIVDALRQIPNLSVKTGHDDILVGWRGMTYWFEIKNPNEIAKKTGEVFNRKRRTNRKQNKLRQTWRGHYKIVSSLEQIIEELRGIS